MYMAGRASPCFLSWLFCVLGGLGFDKCMNMMGHASVGPWLLPAAAAAAAAAEASWR